MNFRTSVVPRRNLRCGTRLMKKTSNVKTIKEFKYYFMSENRNKRGSKDSSIIKTCLMNKNC